jgi:hypothetical protein
VLGALPERRWTAFLWVLVVCRLELLGSEIRFKAAEAHLQDVFVFVFVLYLLLLLQASKLVVGYF